MKLAQQKRGPGASMARAALSGPGGRVGTSGPAAQAGPTRRGGGPADASRPNPCY